MKPPRYDLLDSNDWPEPPHDESRWTVRRAMAFIFAFCIGVLLAVAFIIGQVF